MAAGVGTMMKRAYVAALSLLIRFQLCRLLCNSEIERTDACVKAGQAGDRLTAGLQQLVEDMLFPSLYITKVRLFTLECSGAMSFDFSSMSVLGHCSAT